MSKWPYPPEEKPGPWQTRRIGPVVTRYRRKDRYQVERRNLRRASDVAAEHIFRALRIPELVGWLSRKLR